MVRSSPKLDMLLFGPQSFFIMSLYCILTPLLTFSSSILSPTTCPQLKLFPPLPSLYSVVSRSLALALHTYICLLFKPVVELESLLKPHPVLTAALTELQLLHYKHLESSHSQLPCHHPPLSYHLFAHQQQPLNWFVFELLPSSSS